MSASCLTQSRYTDDYSHCYAELPHTSHAALLCKIPPKWITAHVIPTCVTIFEGYLTAEGVLPSTAPDEPESFQEILKDVDKYIMPGVGVVHDIRTASKS